MKRIGLIGGVSPESTVVYYRLLNAAARKVYGGDTSAEIVIHSLNYGRMHDFYDAGDWDSFIGAVVEAGRSLAAAGCEVIAISSNTTNMAAEAVQAVIDVPFVSLLESLVTTTREKQARLPLLLGTSVVMEGDFYRPTLKRDFDYDTLIPDDADRETIRRVIFDELVEGEVLDASREAYLEVMARGQAAGADSVILGCTEIGLLIDQSHIEMPIFDTTLIHTAAIADVAFG